MPGQSLLGSTNFPLSCSALHAVFCVPVREWSFTLVLEVSLLEVTGPLDLEEESAVMSDAPFFIDLESGVTASDLRFLVAASERSAG